MRIYLSRALFCCFTFFLLPCSFAASLPDDAAVQVRSFTFPKAAYAGAEEESARISAEFNEKLTLVLQEFGLRVNAPSDSIEDQRKEDETPVETEAALDNKTASEKTDEPVADKKEVAQDDPLMKLVTEMEAEEKEQQEKEETKKAAKKSNVYVLSGVITQYEEDAGTPVDTGSTKRSRAKVSLLGSYKVVNPEGKTIILEKLSASASKVVPQTVDIYEVQQSLKHQAFSDAASSIAERISGKKRAAATTEEAEPGSDYDEYADSPGKRLKSKSSGRMKWIIN